MSWGNWKIAHSDLGKRQCHPGGPGKMKRMTDLSIDASKGQPWGFGSKLFGPVCPHLCVSLYFTVTLNPSLPLPTSSLCPLNTLSSLLISPSLNLGKKRKDTLGGCPGTANTADAINNYGSHILTLEFVIYKSVFKLVLPRLADY